ncbi:MAG: hypothetical protein IIB53_14675 [Planctomycetes bacterium]|nr:hypothetical protein [Planctomycetota bacterium]
MIELWLVLEVAIDEATREDAHRQALDAVSDDPEFVAVSIPWAISDEGQIAGQGNHIEFGGVATRLTRILPPLGDLDGDGTVGVSDLLILLGAWGQCDDCNDCIADLDGDCVVGVKDLLILLGNWG